MCIEVPFATVKITVHVGGMAPQREWVRRALPFQLMAVVVPQLVVAVVVELGVKSAVLPSVLVSTSTVVPVLARFAHSSASPSS